MKNNNLKGRALVLLNKASHNSQHNVEALELLKKSAYFKKML